MNDNESRKRIDISGSGTAGIVALCVFFVAAAATIVGICWAGAWMFVNVR